MVVPRKLPATVRRLYRIKRPLSAVSAAVFAVTLLAACSEDGPTQADDRAPSPATSSAAPPQSPGSDCPNEVDSVASGERAGGEVSGDVDGDGSDDLVYVVRDANGPPGCQTFLVAETAAATLSTATEDPGVSYSLQAPRVNSLVQVDGKDGLEVLVDLEQGAATQFLGMFTVAGGSLVKVRIGGGSAYGDLFPYGGSVGHIEASNCTKEKGADLLIAIATANVTDYTIRTVLYEMQGTTLQPLPLNEQPPIATGPDVEASEGFDSSPFGDCPTSP